MTDRAQFEAMLEALINEDRAQAQEIFHNIVVAKSREIYEELLSEDFTEEETEMPATEAFGEEEGEEEGEEDDMAGDEGGDDFGDEMDSDEEGDMDDPATKGDIMDLEDAIEELKAEFEAMMGDQDDMGGDDMGGMDDMGGDDMGGMDAEMDEEDGMVMEYVNKVATPKHGDNGVNSKSIVAGPNRMGGANMMAGSREAKGEGTKGGLLAPSAKEENFGNMNKPGANAGKTAFKKREPGHGAEKKGEAPKMIGAGTGKLSNDAEKNTQSILRQAKR
jgi:hypothetical protein